MSPRRAQRRPAGQRRFRSVLGHRQGPTSRTHHPGRPRTAGAPLPAPGWPQLVQPQAFTIRACIPMTASGPVRSTKVRPDKSRSNPGIPAPFRRISLAGRRCRADEAARRSRRAAGRPARPARRYPARAPQRPAAGAPSARTPPGPPIGGRTPAPQDLRGMDPWNGSTTEPAAATAVPAAVSAHRISPVTRHQGARLIGHTR